jgi:hypothetical protein
MLPFLKLWVSVSCRPSLHLNASQSNIISHRGTSLPSRRGITVDTHFRGSPTEILEAQARAWQGLHADLATSKEMAARHLRLTKTRQPPLPAAGAFSPLGP